MIWLTTDHDTHHVFEGAHSLCRTRTYADVNDAPDPEDVNGERCGMCHDLAQQMETRMQEALKAFKREVTEAATKQFGRHATELECQGVIIALLLGRLIQLEERSQ